MVAAATGRFDTIGIDLVAMCVDDLVCQGAEPLFFLDYVAVGQLDPDHMEQLVAGVAEGCRQAGLLADRRRDGRASRGRWPAIEFDLVGFAVGVGRARPTARPVTRPAGDVLIGLPSPGLRSNGYSLARRVLLDIGRPVARRARVRGRPRTLGRRAARPVGDLRAGDPGRCSTRSTSEPSPTSPVAASPATSTGCCPTELDARGRCRHLGATPHLRRGPDGPVTSTTTRWPRSSTSASAWSWPCPPTRPVQALAVSGAARSPGRGHR